MRTEIVVPLVVALLLVTTGAIGRERMIRTPEPVALPPHTVSGLCTFKASQTSGYRTTAGERKICYFDCEGVQAAIAIRAGGYCSQDQVVLIYGMPDRGPLSAGRSRVKAPPGRESS